MAGLGEVAIDEVAAVFGVEATEGGVDRDGELPTGGTGEAPQEGDREDLFFASGEAVFGDGVAVGVVEAEAKGVGIDLDTLDQVAFAEQIAEVLGDEVFEFVELLQLEALFIFGEGAFDFADRLNHVISIFEVDRQLAVGFQFFFSALDGLLGAIVLVLGLLVSDFHLGDGGLGSADLLLQFGIGFGGGGAVEVAQQGFEPGL